MPGSVQWKEGVEGVRAAEANIAMGESPNAVRIVSREARAGVSGATRPPKQADNGEVGTLAVPRPLRESAGPNESEANCSAVNPRRSNAENGSAAPIPLRRRQHWGPECDYRTAPRHPGVSGRACGEGCGRDSGRPRRVSGGANAKAGPPDRREVSRSFLHRGTDRIRANPEGGPRALWGVGAGRSTEAPAVMVGKGKGLRFGSVERGEPGHPSRREA